jgi:hypothetical protein
VEGLNEGWECRSVESAPEKGDDGKKEQDPKEDRLHSYQACSDSQKRRHQRPNDELDSPACRAM